jgi:hypothetical protein
MARKLFSVFAIGAVLGALIAYVLTPVLQVAVGYPALLACSGVFVQKRSIADLQASDFAYRLELRLVTFAVDHAAHTVTAHLLGGYLASQVAMYAPVTCACALMRRVRRHRL